MIGQSIAHIFCLLIAVVGISTDSFAADDVVATIHGEPQRFPFPSSQNPNSGGPVSTQRGPTNNSHGDPNSFYQDICLEGGACNVLKQSADNMFINAEREYAQKEIGSRKNNALVKLNAVQQDIELLRQGQPPQSSDARTMLDDLRTTANQREAGAASYKEIAEVAKANLQRDVRAKVDSIVNIPGSEPPPMDSGLASSLEASVGRIESSGNGDNNDRASFGPPRLVPNPQDNSPGAITARKQLSSQIAQSFREKAETRDRQFRGTEAARYREQSISYTRYISGDTADYALLQIKPEAQALFGAPLSSGSWGGYETIRAANQLSLNPDLRNRPDVFFPAYFAIRNAAEFAKNLNVFDQAQVGQFLNFIDTAYAVSDMLTGLTEGVMTSFYDPGAGVAGLWRSFNGPVNRAEVVSGLVQGSTQAWQIISDAFHGNPSAALNLSATDLARISAQVAADLLQGVQLVGAARDAVLFGVRGSIALYGMTVNIPSALARYGGLAEVIRFGRMPDVVRTLKLVTESDTAFFWSGRSGSFRAGVEAPRIASTNNGVTLEMIIEQRGVKMPIYDPSDQSSIKAWADVSMEYANGCKGNVRAVIGRNTRPDSIWLTTELPALKANPRVTRITSIDPESGVQTIIFQR